MRRLRKQAEESYEKVISLPPFKYGFENVPIIVRQVNYHSPDMLGDPKRTRELRADMSIFMKHVFSRPKKLIFDDLDKNNNNKRSKPNSKSKSENWNRVSKFEKQEYQVLRKRRENYLARLKSKLHFGKYKNYQNYRRFQTFKHWPLRQKREPIPKFSWNTKDTQHQLKKIDFATKEDLFALRSEYLDTAQKLKEMNKKENRREDLMSEMSYAHHLACIMIGGKRYNAVTSEFRISCNDNYFYFDNERKIVNWFSKLIVEIDRLAQCIDIKTKSLKGIKTWEDYKVMSLIIWFVCCFYIFFRNLSFSIVSFLCFFYFFFWLNGYRLKMLALFV